MNGTISLETVSFDCFRITNCVSSVSGNYPILQSASELVSGVGGLGLKIAECREVNDWEVG